MLVELDVFSGQRNPQWLLDKEHEKLVRALHQSLSQTGDSVPEPPGLGYRGFLYTLDHVDCRAWNGTVRGADRTLQDPGQKIERLLLSLLPPEFAGLRDRIVGQLGPEV